MRRRRLSSAMRWMERRQDERRHRRRRVVHVVSCRCAVAAASGCIRGVGLLLHLLLFLSVDAVCSADALDAHASVAGAAVDGHERRLRRGEERGRSARSADLRWLLRLRDGQEGCGQDGAASGADRSVGRAVRTTAASSGLTPAAAAAARCSLLWSASRLHADWCSCCAWWMWRAAPERLVQCRSREWSRDHGASRSSPSDDGEAEDESEGGGNGSKQRALTDPWSR